MVGSCSERACGCARAHIRRGEPVTPFDCLKVVTESGVLHLQITPEYFVLKHGLPRLDPATGKDWEATTLKLPLLTPSLPQTARLGR